MSLNNDKSADLIQMFEYTNMYGDTHTYRKAWTNDGRKRYLLKKIENSLGGNTSFEYIISSDYDNTGGDDYGDLPMNFWLVSSITRDNGLTGSHRVSSTSHYDYSGGLYDHEDREFRGFGFVEETKPDYTKVRHYYRQDDARKGREYRTETLDSAGNIFLKTDQDWTNTSVDGYFIVNLEGQRKYVYDGQTTPIETETTYDYDDYGNVVKKSSLGDTSVSGDERYEYIEYVYNPSSWIVGKPKHTYLLDYDDSTKIRESYYRYDGLDYGEAPVKGDLTRVEKWLDSGSNPLTRLTYDNYGNLLTETDSNYHTTTYSYDSTGTYPVNVTNPLGQTFLMEYDLGTGNLLWRRDPNGYQTNFVYDVFGRKTKTIKPYDTETYPTEEIIYDLDGTSPEKITVKNREDAGTINTLDSIQYLDGFGNILQEVTESEESGRQIVRDHYYDSNYRVSRQSNPYTRTSTNDYTTPDPLVPAAEYTYDALDRVVELTNPDGTTVTTGFDRDTVTVTDENGNIKEYVKDAYDRIVEVREHNEGEVYTTSYEYNPLDKLVAVTDNQGNILGYSYDTLGRKTVLDDPDLGVWNYTYDAKGNMLSRSDARDEIVTYTYDALDRVLSESAGGETITYTYDDTVIGTLSEISTPLLLTQYGYDMRLRKTSETKVIADTGYTTSYAYDSTSG